MQVYRGPAAQILQQPRPGQLLAQPPRPAMQLPASVAAPVAVRPQLFHQHLPLQAPHPQQQLPLASQQHAQLPPQHAQMPTQQQQQWSQPQPGQPQQPGNGKGLHKMAGNSVSAFITFKMLLLHTCVNMPVSVVVMHIVSCADQGMTGMLHTWHFWKMW